MSAQRRSATKQRSGSAARQPVKTEAPAVQAAGATRPPKPAAPKEKPVDERQSVLSQRFARLRKLIQDTWSEIKKITWPDGQTVRNLTALVIVMSVLLGLLLGGIDYVLLKVFDALS